jgi:hypothetical protein
MQRRIAEQEMTNSGSNAAGLIRFIAVQSAFGVIIGTLFAGIILLTDAWGLATLIRADESPLFSAALFVGIGVALLAPLVVATALFLTHSSGDIHD